MPPVTNRPTRHAGRLRDAPLDSDLLAGLLRPDAFPHLVDRVELVETQISWVPLTGEFAYKVKKVAVEPTVDRAAGLAPPL